MSGAVRAMALWQHRQNKASSVLAHGQALTLVQVSCQVTYPILTIVALVFLMALPVWIASHVYVVIRARTLVGYFELRERGRGERRWRACLSLLGT